MGTKKKVYPVSCYGKHLCLIPDFTMWVIFLFLLRPYVVLIMSFANFNDSMQLINLLYADRMMMSLGALAGIPTALIIYAWIKREPDATQFIRNLWGKGRVLLSVSAALNAGLVFAPMWLKAVDKITIHGWWQFAVSVIILLVVFKSEYIKDCFLDFPKNEL